MSAISSASFHDKIEFPDADRAVLSHERAIHRRESLLSGVMVVDQGFVALVEYLGKYQETAESGFHWVAPLFSTAIRVDKRVIFVDTKPQIAFSRDKQRLLVDGSYYYRITDPCKAVYRVQNLEDGLTTLFQQSILCHIAQLTNDEAVGLNKDQFSNDIKNSLNAQITGAYLQDFFGKSNKRSLALKRVDEEDSIPLDGSGEHFELKPLMSQTRKKGVQSQAHTYGSSGSMNRESSHVEAEDKACDWGVIIERVAITNIAYPASILKALDEKRQTDYRRQITVIEANALKEKTLIQTEAAKKKTEMDAQANLFAVRTQAEAQAAKVEIETKISLQTAEAEAKAHVIRAEGNASSQVINAKAESEAKNLLAKVYQDYPEYARIKVAEIVAQSFADIHSASNSKVIITNSGSGKTDNFATQFLASMEVLSANK